MDNVSQTEIDFLCLLSILPIELWEIVWSNLQDHRNFINLNCASDAFQIFLWPSRNAWGFGQVIPLLYPYLDGKDIANCRQTCRLWKNSIDSFMKNVRFMDPLIPPSGLLYDVHGTPALSFQKLLNWDQYYNKIRVATLSQSNLISANFNMILEGIPCMRNNSSETFKLYAEGINNIANIHSQNFVSIFSQIGKQVSYLRFDFTGTGLDTLEVQYILIELLTHVPNLRGLSIKMDHVDLSTNQEEKLSFPPLKHLEMLEMGGWNSEISNLEESAFPRCYYNNIRKFVTNSNNLFVHLEAFQGTLPNLAVLQLKLNSKEDISKLGKIRSPLRRLHLQILDSDLITLGDIFNAARIFGETLTELKLDSICWESNFVSSNLKKDQNLSFPQLKIIKIYGNAKVSLKDILLISPSLSKFYLEIGTFECTPGNHFYHSPIPGDMVQIHGYVDRMYESGIWNLIPSLGKIRFFGWKSHHQYVRSVYTRDEYTQRNRNQ